MDTTMKGAGGLQFLLNCTNFNQQQLESISLARGASGGTSLLILFIFLSLLVANKAFKTTLQRLFLYYVIILLLLETALTLQVEHYFKYNGQELVCKMVGFLSQYTACVLVTFINEIMIYLIYVTYYRLKGKQSPLNQSVWLKISLEWILVNIAIIVPAPFVWSPLLNDSYGLNGAVCGMKTITANCETVGFWEQVILAVFSYLGGIVTVVSTIVLVSMYCKMTLRYHHVQSQQTKEMLQHTLLLSGLITIASLVPLLLSLLYVAIGLTINKEVYAISLSKAISTPVSMLLVPGSFLVFTYTTKAEQSRRRGCSKYCTRLLGQSSIIVASTTTTNVPLQTEFEICDEHAGGESNQTTYRTLEEQPLVVSTRF